MQTIRDTYKFQRERIIRIVEELAPGRAVQFDDSSTFIRFRVRDPLLNINLTEVSGEWLASELADKSDDRLRGLIRNLSGGKI
jgi:hypothetical protein